MLADLEPFLPRIRALFPDTRGHGLSQKFERPEDYTYARKAEDLLLWLDDLGVRDAVWGGASMGAALALWAAAHAPDGRLPVLSLDPLLEQVRRETEMHRSGAAGRRDANGFADVATEMGCRAGGPRRLGDRRRESELVDVMELVGPGLPPPPDPAAQHQHGYSIEECLGNPRQRVG